MMYLPLWLGAEASIWVFLMAFVVLLTWKWWSNLILSLVLLAYRLPLNCLAVFITACCVVYPVVLLFRSRGRAKDRTARSNATRKNVITGKSDARTSLAEQDELEVEQEASQVVISYILQLSSAIQLLFPWSSDALKVLAKMVDQPPANAEPRVIAATP